MFTRISEELKEESIIMRIFQAGKATLKEMETYYSLDDLLFIDACLDIKDEYEQIESL